MKKLILFSLLFMLTKSILAQSYTITPNSTTLRNSNSVFPLVIGAQAGFNGTIDFRRGNFISAGISSFTGIKRQLRLGTGDIFIDSNADIVIDSTTKNVGIRTINPLAQFHINAGNSGVLPFTNTNLFIENDNHNYLHMGATDGFDTGILFSNTIHNPSFGGSIQYKSDNRMLFQTNALTRMLIGATGRVGINTTSPDARLHVFNGSSGVSGTPADELIVENNANNYIQMMNPQANEAGLLFGLPSSLVSGGIIYNNASSGALDFRTNNNITQVRIDNTGKVGIGTTSPAAKLDVNGKVAADSTVVHTLNVNKNDLNQTRILEVSSVFGSDQVIVGKNGTAVHEIIRAVINRDMGPILSQNTQYEVFNITNVDFQSTVTVSPNFNLPDGLIIENARVTAVGQVTVKFYNATSGIVNPVVGDFVFIVIK